MKDLKHLLYFENLLQEAHNDLIAQAQNEGKICVAYACENTPEPLLNLPGSFSTRLRAPRTGSMEEETLKELKTRRPDKKTPYRARVVVVGSEVDDIDFIKLVEETGAYVCADRFCYGSFPGRDPIVLTDDEDALTQICRQYMNRAQCPRYMNMPKMIGRREYVNQLAKEYEADGIIYEQIKFCDPWAYERMLGSHILNDDYGYPVLSVDRPYNIASSGQMRTRVQAFVESMEIKKIQGGKQ